jgi:hypothetical protein
VSLHLGILVMHAKILDLVTTLCREHPGLNRPFRPLLGDEGIANRMSALRAELAARLEEVDVLTWLAEWNAGHARVTGLGLRSTSDADSDEGWARLTVTMVPPASAGRRWKVGGIELKPDSGTLAVIAALKDGPIAVRDLLEIAGAQVGRAEARAAFDLLVGKGFVETLPPPSDGSASGERAE